MFYLSFRSHASGTNRDSAHHTGSIPIVLEQDTNARNKKKSRRVKTLFKKAVELQEISGCKVFLFVKDMYNHVTFGGSPELRDKFINGTLHLETAKRKEVSLQVVHPVPTENEHLHSIYPGNNNSSRSTIDHDGTGTGPTEPSEMDVTLQGQAEESASETPLEAMTGEGSPQPHLDETPAPQNSSNGSEEECEQVVIGATSARQDCNENVSANNKDDNHYYDADDDNDDDDEENDDDDEEPLILLKNMMDGKVDSDSVDSDEDDSVYTAECVKKRRCVQGKVEYLIKWKGWGQKHNSWEPEEHILDKVLIENFNKKQGN